MVTTTRRQTFWNGLAAVLGTLGPWTLAAGLIWFYVYTHWN